MGRLTVWDADTGREELRTEDLDRIAEALRCIGVRFERWPVADLPAGPPPTRSWPPTARTSTPSWPAAAPARRTSSSSRPTTRSATRCAPSSSPSTPTPRTRSASSTTGAGNFVMHVGGRVYDAHCTRGDLISVPANTHHWFDAGERPAFTVLRVFTDTSGWAPHYTGTDIAERFPVVVG